MWLCGAWTWYRPCAHHVRTMLVNSVDRFLIFSKRAFPRGFHVIYLAIAVKISKRCPYVYPLRCYGSGTEKPSQLPLVVPSDDLPERCWIPGQSTELAPYRSYLCNLWFFLCLLIGGTDMVWAGPLRNMRVKPGGNPKVNAKLL